jgi:hypothetical protein
VTWALQISNGGKLSSVMFLHPCKCKEKASGRLTAEALWASATRRQALPDHLPREDVAIDIEERVCPCCGGALHAIGETVSEMLDFVPARLRVLRIRRPKYGCRVCGNDPSGRGTRAAYRQGNGEPRSLGACAGEQILRPHAALPPDSDRSCTAAAQMTEIKRGRSIYGGTSGDRICKIDGGWNAGVEPRFGG